MAKFIQSKMGPFPSSKPYKNDNKKCTSDLKIVTSKFVFTILGPLNFMSV